MYLVTTWTEMKNYHSCLPFIAFINVCISRCNEEEYLSGLEIDPGLFLTLTLNPDAFSPLRPKIVQIIHGVISFHMLHIYICQWFYSVARNGLSKQMVTKFLFDFDVVIAKTTNSEINKTKWIYLFKNKLIIITA